MSYRISKIGVLLSILMAGSAHAQDSTRQNVRYCGVGLQGDITSFQRDNPTMGNLYANPAFRNALYKILLDRSKAAGWKINLFGKDEPGGAGSNLGLSHVITFENVEVEPFVDPRDGNAYFNVAYSIGVNAVLFDMTDKQIKGLVPSIIVFNEVRPQAPDAAARAAGFRAIFQGFGVNDSAIERWAASMHTLPISYDERTFFQVAPVVLSDAAKASLANIAPGNSGQSPAAFSKHLTAQYEALLASSFNKPIVPVAINPDGTQAKTSQYVANIPECLGASSNLTLPDPSYRMRLTVDKLSTANLRHDLAATENGLSRGTYQTEFAYGARIKSEILQFDSLNGDKPIDSRTFRYVRSLRFTGERSVNTYTQYSKLTSSFMKELLAAYASQDKDWVKASMSAAPAEKQQRDPSATVKDWKKLIQGTMKITPPTSDNG